MAGLNKAAIIIPFYREELSHLEKISLLQCEKALSAYPKIAVKPDSLTLPPEALALSHLSTVSFNDEYFRDVQGYNRLMLSEGFYKSFTEYEYILIHQLDAFVFRDELHYWCAQGFDYIGAPWINPKSHSNILSTLLHRIKNYRYVRYNVKDKHGVSKVQQLENRVGNGGFSLRRVDLFANYCLLFKPLIDAYIISEGSWFNEDIFWSIELNRKKKRLKIPALKTALHFAIETHPARALRLNHDQLPFGCHAWGKHTDFWRPIFEKLGYTI
jgi:hypothetical protein